MTKFLGHQRQYRMLHGVLESPRKPHALLLSGPQGTGKYLAALSMVGAYLKEGGHFHLLGTNSANVVVLRDLSRTFVAPLSQLSEYLALERLSLPPETLRRMLEGLAAHGFLEYLRFTAGPAPVVSFQLNFEGIVKPNPQRVDFESLDQVLRKISGKDGEKRLESLLAKALFGLFGTRPYVGTIKIDDVRDYVQAPLSYVSGDKPVCIIIDDAHLLTEEAENALLKVLEEPPSLCLIVLISHQESALLPTIRSRCQNLTFGYQSEETLLPLLRESHGLQGRALETAYHLCGGTVRGAFTYDETADRLLRAGLLSAYRQLKERQPEGIMQLGHLLYPHGEEDRNRRRHRIEYNLFLLGTLVRDLDLTLSGAGTPLYHQDLQSRYHEFLRKTEARFFLEDYAVIEAATEKLRYNLHEILALEAMATEIFAQP